MRGDYAMRVKALTRAKWRLRAAHGASLAAAGYIASRDGGGIILSAAKARIITLDSAYSVIIGDIEEVEN